MTPRAAELIAALRPLVTEAIDLPHGEGEPILSVLIETIRAARPETIRSLATGFGPTEPAPTTMPVAA